MVHIVKSMPENCCDFVLFGHNWAIQFDIFWCLKKCGKVWGGSIGFTLNSWSHTGMWSIFYLHLSELQLVSDISDFILNDFPFFLFPREHFSSSIEQFRKSFLVKTSFLFNLEFLYKFDLILIFNQFFLCYPCDASLKPKKLSSEELLGQEWHGSRKLTELLDILCFGSCVLSCQ